jgi:hypothetical protein
VYGARIPVLHDGLLLEAHLQGDAGAAVQQCSSAAVQSTRLPDGVAVIDYLRCLLCLYQLCVTDGFPCCHFCPALDRMILT